METKTYLQVGLAVLLLSSVGCGARTELSLPEELAGARRVTLESGETAQSTLASMHRGVDFGAYRSAIGTYRGENIRVVVYLTVFDNVADAEKMMTAMSENIRAGKAPEFVYTGEFQRQGTTVYQATSGEQTNYFFQQGKANVWITVVGEGGEEVLNDFLAKFGRAS